MKTFIPRLCVAVAVMLLPIAQSTFAASARVYHHCADKNGWQPASWKTYKKVWISNGKQNGWYQVRKQSLGCMSSNNICTLHHVLGRPNIAACQGQYCYIFSGTNWDLNLARSYCSIMYQKENNIIGHGHGPSAAKVFETVLGVIASGGALTGTQEAVSALAAGG